MKNRLYRYTVLLITGVLFIQHLFAQTSLTVTGPIKVDAGSYQDYSASSSCGTGNIFCWSGTNGTVSTLTTCGAAIVAGGGGVQPLTSGCNQCYTQTMHWNNVATMQTGTVSASTDGTCISSGSLTVTLVPALNTSAITISPTTQYVALNAATTTITKSGTPTGGDATYSYQWDSSPDNTNWTYVSTGTSFTPPSNVSGITYYRLRVVSFDYVSYFYASVTVLDPGSISTSQTNIYYNNVPFISAVNATGGNCSGSYTYQWQTSINNGSSWSNIGGNVAAYPGTALTVNTLIRRKVTCGTVTAYTNTLSFTVPFAAGFITAPGAVNASTSFTITGTASTGGYSPSGYSYQWEKSTDGINYTTMSGKTSQNLPITSGITALTWYRRKDMNGTPYLYTNFTRVKINSTVTLIKPNGVTAPTSTKTPVTIQGYGNLIDPNDMNFVRIREFTKPGISDTATANATTGIYDVHQTTIYCDNLGRALQTVAKQATPAQNDFIGLDVYDGFGRKSQQFLPYTDNMASGNFRTDISTKQPAFYNDLYNNLEGFYYSNTIFESSPLNTIVQKTAPGKSWTGSMIGGMQNTRVNTAIEDTKIWYIDVSPDSTLPRIVGVYNPGSLVEQITNDENDNETITYTDLNGRIVLKKVEISDTLQSGHDGWLCTYYVYDYFGKLRFVIPPKAVQYISSNGWTITSSIATDLCYRYSYDQRKRVIIKKVPGAGEMWMVYDARDRIVMTQDSLLRSNGKWSVISYDTQNRPTKTIIWNDTHNRVYHQNLASGSTTYPSLNGAYSTLTENFYDDYSWKNRVDIAITGHGFTTKFNTTTDLPVIQTNPYAITPTSTAETRSLATGTRVKVLDPNNDSLFTYTINLYDDHNRPVQVYCTNITGGWDTITTKYDFSNKVISSCATHGFVSVKGPIKWNEVVTALNYDHGNRVIETKKYLNRSTIAENVNSYIYDELGRIKSKKLGNKPIEVLNYDYTLQNWLKGINKGYADSSTSTSHWYGIDISYDYGFNQTQLNGNIAGIVWKTQGDDSAKAFGYDYDNCNRLLKADFTQQIGSNYSKGNQLDFNIDSLQYDANGNILTMQQKGLIINTSSVIDHLSYSYQGTNALSNKLAKVSDNSGNIVPLGDFKDSTNTNDDYNYDGNGNLTLDNNKHISNITYNVLNLPQTISVKGKGIISYIYDAVGNKVQMMTIDSTVAGNPKKDTVTYTGMYVYNHDTLQLIAHEEGRIRPKLIDPNGGWAAANLQYVYDYFVKDHLGNVRVVLTEEMQTDTYAATMEAMNATTENLLFDSVSSTQYAVPVGFEPTTGIDTSNHFVSRLNASSAVNKRVGPTILLKVMAGDTLTASTYAWYNGAVQQPGTQPSLLNSIGTLFADGVLGASGGKFIQTQEGALTTAAGPALTSFLSVKDAAFVNTAPKAFLNWALLDDRFNYLQGGVSQIPTIISGQSKQVLTAMLPATIPKNGYLYIYVSNESPQDVYFDNLTIQHHRGPLVQEDHFYAFGLQMAGICSKAALNLENRYKFNAGTELNDKFDVNYYETSFRNYDPQLGRFTGIDPATESFSSLTPYRFGFNNPVSFNDPTGALEGVGLGVYYAIVNQIAAGGNIEDITINGQSVDYLNASDQGITAGTSSLDQQRIDDTFNSDKLSDSQKARFKVLLGEMYIVPAGHWLLEQLFTCGNTKINVTMEKPDNPGAFAAYTPEGHKLKLGNVLDPSYTIDDYVLSPLVHEMFHAYQDFSSIKKGTSREIDAHLFEAIFDIQKGMDKQYYNMAVSSPSTPDEKNFSDAYNGFLQHGFSITDYGNIFKYFFTGSNTSNYKDNDGTNSNPNKGGYLIYGYINPLMYFITSHMVF